MAFVHVRDQAVVVMGERQMAQPGDILRHTLAVFTGS